MQVCFSIETGNPSKVSSCLFFVRKIFLIPPLQNAT
jgi:hypothetical protein